MIHINRFHLDEQDVELHKCEKCPLMTKAKSNLANHMKSHLNDEDRKWYKYDIFVRVFK